MLEFLPVRYKEALTYLNKNLLSEIRIRANSPSVVLYGGEKLFLSAYGVKKKSALALVSSEEEIEEIVSIAGGRSVYAFAEELKRGFLTVDGVRIGIGGTYVEEHESIVSVRNFTSLCIRIPHFIDGCANTIMDMCLKEKNSVLIMSPPGCGKTTMLKDLIKRLSPRYNVLVADERGELFVDGACADYISFADKHTALSCGIRSLCPEFIITDELEDKDYSSIKKVISGGVKVIASAHLKDFSSVKERIFDYYVLLKGGQVGKIEGIYSD